MNFVVIKARPVFSFFKAMDELVDASEAAVNLFSNIDFDLALFLHQLLPPVN
jgi:hypothetical protein